MTCGASVDGGICSEIGGVEDGGAGTAATVPLLAPPLLPPPATTTPVAAGAGLSIMLEASLDPVATGVATSAEVCRRSNWSRSQRSSVALRGRDTVSLRTL